MKVKNEKKKLLLSDLKKKKKKIPFRNVWRRWRCFRCAHGSFVLRWILTPQSNWKGHWRSMWTSVTLAWWRSSGTRRGRDSSEPESRAGRSRLLRRRDFLMPTSSSRHPGEPVSLNKQSQTLDTNKIPLITNWPDLANNQSLATSCCHLLSPH